MTANICKTELEHLSASIEKKAIFRGHEARQSAQLNLVRKEPLATGSPDFGGMMRPLAGRRERLGCNRTIWRLKTGTPVKFGARSIGAFLYNCLWKNNSACYAVSSGARSQHRVYQNGKRHVQQNPAEPRTLVGLWGLKRAFWHVALGRFCRC